VDADALIGFMGRLAGDAGHKAFLILDNLRACHSKEVQEWLSERKDRIEAFCLPPYAPGHDPDGCPMACRCLAGGSTR
jgi:hypothetical protein